MSSNTVRIEEVNNNNWYDCCLLEISEEQRDYVESNAISIAQSKFESTLKPYAIYYKDQIVGFLMFNAVKEELGGYWIYRIMIDRHFQGKGIGKEATKQIINEIAKLPDATKVIVGYHPENKAAHHLYASLGFVDNGDRFGKEMAVIQYLTE
ncbi:GNAT family N-acetyltransferase [Lysinibacillus sphaericus]|uniref:GNAT family N-acetyltransferase n=1 Tax=Lysinibacillus sphaericus TaxID=1421 RepID=UPI00191103B7|nr:GNAT family N-acetyltransferase [Lysinibacillus sphaericus]QPA54277.1 GNAT family N-acetyltransferase [Lysinibacillus sphaericus]